MGADCLPCAQAAEQGLCSSNNRGVTCLLKDQEVLLCHLLLTGVFIDPAKPWFISGPVLLLQPGLIYSDMAIVPCPWFVFYEQRALLWLLEEHEGQCSGGT